MSLGIKQRYTYIHTKQILAVELKTMCIFCCCQKGYLSISVSSGACQDGKSATTLSTVFGVSLLLSCNWQGCERNKHLFWSSFSPCVLFVSNGRETRQGCERNKHLFWSSFSPVCAVCKQRERDATGGSELRSCVKVEVAVLGFPS